MALFTEKQLKRLSQTTDGFGDLPVFATEPQSRSAIPATPSQSQQPAESDWADVWQGVKNVPGALSALGRDINAEGNRWVGENIVQPVVKPLAAIYDIATNPTDRYAGMTQSEVRAAGGDPAIARIGDVDMLTAAGRKQSDEAKADMQALSAKLKPGGYGMMVQSGLTSAVQNVGNMAAAAGLASMTGGGSVALPLVQNLTLGLMGAQSGLMEYGENRGKGFSPAASTVRGLGSGGLEVATEKAPLGSFMDLIAPSAKRGAAQFLKKLGTYGLQDIGGEVINTLVGDMLYEKFAGKPGITPEEGAKAVNDYFASGEAWEATKQTIGATLVQTGAMGGSAALIRKLTTPKHTQQTGSASGSDTDLTGSGNTIPVAPLGQEGSTDTDVASDLANYYNDPLVQQQVAEQNAQVSAQQQQQEQQAAQAAAQQAQQTEAAKQAEQQRFNSLTPDQQQEEKLATYQQRYTDATQKISDINDQLSDPDVYSALPEEQIKQLKSQRSVLADAQKAAKSNIDIITKQREEQAKIKKAQALDTQPTADMYTRLGYMQTMGQNMPTGDAASADSQVLSDQIDAANLTADQGVEISRFVKKSTVPPPDNPAFLKPTGVLAHKDGSYTIAQPKAEPVTDKDLPEIMETIATAYDNGHAMEDYALENFGKVDGKVYVLDADSMTPVADATFSKEELLAKAQAKLAPKATTATADSQQSGVSAAPPSQPKYRKLNEYGEVTDGVGIKPREQFSTSSGRVTTPFPHQKGEKYATQWLIDNAVAEAEARGDDFNARVFKGERPSKRGDMPQASKDSMTMYLFGQQPQVVRSILKPLTPVQPTGVPEVQAASSNQSLSEETKPLQPANADTKYELPKSWKSDGTTYTNKAGDRATRKRDGTWNVHDVLGGTPDNVPTLDDALKALAANEEITLKERTDVSPPKAKESGSASVADKTGASSDVNNVSAQQTPTVAEHEKVTYTRYDYANNGKGKARKDTEATGTKQEAIDHIQQRLDRIDQLLECVRRGK